MTERYELVLCIKNPKLRYVAQGILGRKCDCGIKLVDYPDYVTVENGKVWVHWGADPYINAFHNANDAAKEILLRWANGKITVLEFMVIAELLRALGNYTAYGKLVKTDRWF